MQVGAKLSYLEPQGRVSLVPVALSMALSCFHNGNGVVIGVVEAKDTVTHIMIPYSYSRRFCGR